VLVIDEIVDGRYCRSRTFDETAVLAPKAFPDASISVGEPF